MKTKFLQALIVDQDPAQGKAMALLIKDLFNKVQYEQNAEEILKECQDVKPRVMFFNLNIAQRTKNFEILEKLPIGGDTQTIIFGYVDAQEPELVAHAIEVGFNDIFVRPFDADIVATKISKFFQFDKTQDREINYTPVRPTLKGTLNLPLKVLSIDENGFEFRCDHFLSKGSVFQISDPLIMEIFEETSIQLMVTRTWLGEAYGDYLFYAEPKMPGEKNSSALRRFILRKL